MLIEFRVRLLGVRINLKSHHMTKIREHTEHKSFDFLTDVPISDELKQCAEDFITQLWRADKKPDWFAESVWFKKLVPMCNI